MSTQDSNINWLRIWLILSVLLVLLGTALLIARLHPPRQMVLAAGPADGAYIGIARHYRELLARDGIALELRETAGSVENAHLLESGAVDAAIIQGGVAVAPDGVEAIGTVFFEPMVFLSHQDVLLADNPALWKNLRISSGQPGSGTAAAFADFERVAGLAHDANRHFGLPYGAAVTALARHEIDLAVFVAPIGSPYLLDAYGEPTIHHMSLDYVEAIARRLEYANTVTVPAGAISLLPVIPYKPEKLLALEARLAIRSDLHPALINRLTMAALDLHGVRDVITDPGTFPSVEGTGLPVNNAARQLILHGPSTWHDWLPYWMAAQVNRVFLLLLPILFIVLPMLRAVPALYAFGMRWRVWQHYPEIRRIEELLSPARTAADLAEMDARLTALDEKLSLIRMPPAFRQTAYDARLHIAHVRGRIAALTAALTGGAGAGPG